MFGLQSKENKSGFFGGTMKGNWQTSSIPVTSPVLRTTAVTDAALGKNEKVLAREAPRSPKLSGLEPAEYEEIAIDFTGRTERWPNPTGDTALWMPPTLDLVTVKSATGEFELKLQHEAYQPFLYSWGPGPGTYTMDMATRYPAGNWAGMRIGEFRPGEWWPFEPGPGNYAFSIKITKDDAQRIRQLEGEHVADFLLAWNLSIGLVEEHIDGLFPGTAEELLGQLVDGLINAKLRYLIPPTPDDFSSWGKWLKTVYATLAECSHDRDRNKEHTPSGYVYVPTGATKLDTPLSWKGNTVSIQPVLPKSGTPSEWIVRTDRLGPPGFTSDSYAAYLQKQTSST
jgi:hypothetical protein